MLFWIPNYMSSLSLDMQLMQLIFKKVKKGDLIPGDRLPTSRELSKQTMVSENVINQAYYQLDKLQLINFIGQRVSWGYVSDLAIQRVEEISSSNIEFPLDLSI